jgi:hypothetical protein
MPCRSLSVLHLMESITEFSHWTAGVLTVENSPGTRYPESWIYASTALNMAME